MFTPSTGIMQYRIQKSLARAVKLALLTRINKIRILDVVLCEAGDVPDKLALPDMKQGGIHLTTGAVQISGLLHMQC